MNFYVIMRVIYFSFVITRISNEMLEYSNKVLEKNNYTNIIVSAEKNSTRILKLIVILTFIFQLRFRI